MNHTFELSQIVSPHVLTFFCMKAKNVSEVCVALTGLLKHRSEREDVVELKFGVAQWL